MTRTITFSLVLLLSAFPIGESSFLAKRGTKEEKEEPAAEEKAAEEAHQHQHDHAHYPKMTSHTALDSPQIQAELARLSGKKLDGEKLKKAYLNDPWAPMKTVMGSEPVFNYMQLEKNGAIERDTQVDGMTTNEAAPTYEAAPLGVSRKELQGAFNVYEDYEKNKKTASANVAKKITQTVGAPMKSAQLLWNMARTGRLTPALKSGDPTNFQKWIEPIEDDPDNKAWLDKRENNVETPMELSEPSDIQDWLNGKIMGQ